MGEYIFSNLNFLAKLFLQEQRPGEAREMTITREKHEIDRKKDGFLPCSIIFICQTVKSLTSVSNNRPQSADKPSFHPASPLMTCSWLQFSETSLYLRMHQITTDTRCWEYDEQDMHSEQCLCLCCVNRTQGLCCKRNRTFCETAARLWNYWSNSLYGLNRGDT